MRRAPPLLLTVLLVSGTAQAASGGPTVYYERHGEGWFWYHDPEPKPAVDPEAPATSAPAPTDPLATLHAFQEQLERAKARAILEPTAEHVRDYLQLNQLAMNRAGDFAQTWQRVVWTTPGLDTRLAHPVNDQAVQLYNDEKLQRVDAFLEKTAQTHGLFFLFKGSCPYCHKFAPVLKAFAEAYGFHVIPISLDGGALPEFPTPRRDAAVSLKLNVDTVPAVFLVNPGERAIHPVAFGYVSASELKQRLYTLLNREPADPLVQTMQAGDRIDAFD